MAAVSNLGAQSQEQQTRTRPGIILLVGAVAAIVLIGLALTQAIRFFRPLSASASRPATAQEKTEHDLLTQKARESDGDFAKLSAEDRQRLFAQYGSQAPILLRQAAHPIAGQ